MWPALDLQGQADLAWGCFLAKRTDLAAAVAGAVTAGDVLRVAPDVVALLRADGQAARADVAQAWADAAAVWVLDGVSR
jgi:hypothetical protein